MGKTKGLRGDARALERALSGKTRPRQKERNALELFRAACERNDSAEAAKVLKDCPSLATIEASESIFVSAAPRNPNLRSPLGALAPLTPPPTARRRRRSATLCDTAPGTACSCSWKARRT